MKELGISDFGYEKQVKYSILLLNNEFGDDLLFHFNKILSIFLQILEFNSAYYEITPFQSNRREDQKKKFIGNSKVIHILEAIYDSFYKKWGTMLTDLNNEVELINKYLLVQEEGAVISFGHDILPSETFNSIIQNLSKSNVLIRQKEEKTFLNFQVKDLTLFKKELLRYIQERIDEVTSPIIHEILLIEAENQYPAKKVDFSSLPKGKKVIFISYSQIDEPIYKIKKIAHTLSYFDDISEVFIWETHAKEDIMDFMGDAIDQCDALLVFCSPNATKSRWVSLELKMALKSGKKIIPIFINEDDLPIFTPFIRGVKFNPFNFQQNIEEIHSLIKEERTN